MYIAIRIIVSYESEYTYYPIVFSLDVPLDMVHLLQSNYQWCAGASTILKIRAGSLLQLLSGPR